MTEQESPKQTTEVEHIEENNPPKANESQSGEQSETNSAKRSGRKKRKPRLRIFPIWLRIILSIVLIGGSLLLGLIVGYGVIGDGSPADALKTETWYHIIDIIRGET